VPLSQLWFGRDLLAWRAPTTTAPNSHCHTATLAAVSRPVAHVFHAPDTQRPSDPATQRAREVGRRVHGAPVSCPSNHGATCAMATAATVCTRQYMMRPSVARHVVERHHHHDLHRQYHRGLHRQHHQQHQHQHAHTRPQDVRSRLGKDCAWPIPLRCPVSTNRRSLTRRSRASLLLTSPS
jgi:hypothetical protein